MKLRSNEWLKLTTLDDERGERVLDIRVWKKTPTGGIPTKKCLTMRARMLIPLIVGLQRTHEKESSFLAKEEPTKITQG